MSTVIPWPSAPHTWLLTWVIWRFRNKPLPRPTSIPADVKKAAPYAYAVLQWVEWKRNFEQGPRPPVPTKIPKWGWDILKQTNIAVPLTPPEPEPEPGPPIPANSWTLTGPIAYTAWGWDLDWRTPSEIDGICRLITDSGFKAVGLQRGRFGGEIPGILRGFGQKVFLWGTASSEDEAVLDAHGLDGYQPQVEGTGEYEAAISNFRAGFGAGRSRSIVTTLAGLYTFTSRPDGTDDGHPTTVETEELAEAGCTHMWVECYSGDMQPRSVSQLMFTAKQWRGAYHSNPVIGLARPEVTVGSYQPEVDIYGAQVGAYLIEQMQKPRDFDAIRALVG